MSSEKLQYPAFPGRIHSVCHDVHLLLHVQKKEKEKCGGGQRGMRRERKWLKTKWLDLQHLENNS